MFMAAKSMSFRKYLILLPLLQQVWIHSGMSINIQLIPTIIQNKEELRFFRVETMAKAARNQTLVATLKRKLEFNGKGSVNCVGSYQIIHREQLFRRIISPIYRKVQLVDHS
jgi:hypothetical protein